MNPPNSWILLILKGVAVVALLLLLSRLICRRRSIESPAFAAKCDQFVAVMRRVATTLWEGGWRGGLTMLVVGIVVATCRLMFGVPTYFLLESGAEGLWPVAFLFRDAIWEHHALWNTTSRLLVFSTAIPDVVGAGFIVGAASRSVLATTRWRPWFRIAVACFVAAYFALLCRHHPWSPKPYDEQEAWVTHSNVLFSVRVPATWRIVMASNTVDDAWMCFQSPNGTNVAVFSASALARGPCFPYCLCAPVEAYAYARSADTHKWVLEDEFGQGLKISSPRFVGGVHSIGYQRSELSPRALNHLLDSFRFLDPPAEPRP